MPLSALRSRPSNRLVRGFCSNRAQHGRAVVTTGYGDAPEVLELRQDHPTADLRPHDVLVQVRAASVNPMDVDMRAGYMRQLLAPPRLTEFPFVLGRDCSGEVAAVGSRVWRFKQGDHVWGAASPYTPGTHAEWAVLPSDWLAHKPASCSHEEAAAVPYVALTALSALAKVRRGQRVAINGGTGGIGMFAVPYLKHMCCEVTITCSASSAEFGGQLGADHVLCYEDLPGELEAHLGESSKFDVVIDTQGSDEFEELMRSSWIVPNGHFVTLKSPINAWLTQYGLVQGIGRTAADFVPMQAAMSAHSVLRALEGAAPSLHDALNQAVNHAAQSAQPISSVCGALPPTFKEWAFFGTYGIPSGRLLEHTSRLVEDGVIRPHVHALFDLEKFVDAHEMVERGTGVHGKVVLRM